MCERAGFLTPPNFGTVAEKKPPKPTDRTVNMSTTTRNRMTLLEKIELLNRWHTWYARDLAVWSSLRMAHADPERIERARERTNGSEGALLSAARDIIDHFKGYPT